MNHEVSRWKGYCELHFSVIPKNFIKCNTNRLLAIEGRECGPITVGIEHSGRRPTFEIECECMNVYMWSSTDPAGHDLSHSLLPITSPSLWERKDDFDFFFLQMNCRIQLTLDQHGFELLRSTYTWILKKYIVQYCKCIFSIIFSIIRFLNISSNIFFSLAYFIVRMQSIRHITYKRCVNQHFMLSVRLLVTSRLLVIKFVGIKSHTWIFPWVGVP